MTKKPQTLRYAKCRGCGRKFSTKQAGRDIRCSCKAYADEITKNEYERKEKVEAPKPEKLEKPMENPAPTPDITPEKPEKQTENNELLLELDERLDESDFESMELEEIPNSNLQPAQNVEVVPSENNSGLGALIIFSENALFKFTNKEALSEAEREAIRLRSQPVAEKYKILTKNGREVELLEAATTPIFSRYNLSDLKKKSGGQVEN